MGNRISTNIIAELTNLLESQSQPELEASLQLLVFLKLWTILDKSHFQTNKQKKQHCRLQFKKYKKRNILDLPVCHVALEEPLSC